MGGRPDAVLGMREESGVGRPAEVGLAREGEVGGRPDAALGMREESGVGRAAEVGFTAKGAVDGRLGIGERNGCPNAT